MSNPTSANQCPACGAPVPEGAPQGLCPKCLLAGVGQTQEITSPGSELHSPPALEEVAAAFPQLEILELIGQGGMGCVFKARQPKLDRFVALKLLPSKFASDAMFRERFSREARVLARLNHPSIVGVFDFGEAGGFFYLLMEFVDGANLRQAMQAGRFTADQALAIVPKICEALQFAHGEGILHRDIKPENILLDLKGRVKIADFGIAKLVGESRPVTRLTGTGAAIGTPQYMAPEQFEHPQEVDHRADIYSLGVVFYEMLTGELPLGRFAPPSHKAAMDPRVDEVVLRTLEKEREKRYQSAGEVRTSVEHLTQTPASTPSGASLPAFNPAEDFILCPPQLPRMAKAIIVYALVVAPLMWLVGLFTFEALPDHAIVGFAQAGLNVVVTLIEFVLLVLLAIGAWKLRGLRLFAPFWLKTILWLHLGWIVLALAGEIWVSVLQAELMPNAPDPELGVGDGVLLALFLAALVFEISALVWLHRHKGLLASVCGAGRRTESTPGATTGVPQWSRAAIVGAVLTGISLPIPLFIVMMLLAGPGALGPMEIVLLFALTGFLGVPGTIMGWVGVSDIRTSSGSKRGLPLAIFAALAGPLTLLVIGTLIVPWFIMRDPSTAEASPNPASFWLLIPAGAITFAIWSVFATVRWGTNHPRSERRGVLKWIFLALFLALLGGAMARWPRTMKHQPMEGGLRDVSNQPVSDNERAVSVEAAAPPRETFVITGMVTSNGVPISAGELRAKLWPPATHGPSAYVVRWQMLAGAASNAVPWEIVVEDKTSGTIAARLRPVDLPRLNWTTSPQVPNLSRREVTHEAFAIEVARALQSDGGGNAGAADWSLRLQLQSSPLPPASAKRGIDLDFVLPANQVVTFELVTRSNGVIVPLTEFAAFQVNGTPEPYTGKFILADDPDDLDSFSGLPRWRFGIIGSHDRLLETGQGIRPVPADFSLNLSMWKQLDGDKEIVEGLSDSSSSRPAYGLRIRTQEFHVRSGLRHTSSGFGTNWMKEAGAQMAPAKP